MIRSDVRYMNRLDYVLFDNYVITEGQININYPTIQPFSEAVNSSLELYFRIDAIDVVDPVVTGKYYGVGEYVLLNNATDYFFDTKIVSDGVNMITLPGFRISCLFNGNNIVIGKTFTGDVYISNLCIRENFYDAQLNVLNGSNPNNIIADVINYNPVTNINLKKKSK